MHFHRHLTVFTYAHEFIPAAKHMQYICTTTILCIAMSLLKDETLSIRTSSEIKQLVRLAAERERRSVSSMIEILVLDYARQHKLQPASTATAKTKKTAK
jgi:hypothetical protein